MFAEETGRDCLLVLVGDMGGFLWLEPARSFTAQTTAQNLMKLCAMTGEPKVWVSDTTTHFRNGLSTKLVEALGMEQHFSVAHHAWRNGTAERFAQKVVKTGEAILGEAGRLVSRWVQATPEV